MEVLRFVGLALMGASHPTLAFARLASSKKPCLATCAGAAVLVGAVAVQNAVLGWSVAGWAPRRMGTRPNISVNADVRELAFVHRRAGASNIALVASLAARGRRLPLR
jgi:hypothetical protein